MTVFSSRNIELAVLVLIVVVVVAVPWCNSRFLIYSLTITAIYASVVTSLNLLLGLAGQASFGQTTFMAIGGYGSALLTTRLDIEPWLAMFISAGLALIAAVIIGYPLSRLRGYYLSMGTFALGLGTYSFVVVATPLTNGATGISGVPPFEIGSLSFGNPLAFYVLSWSLCGLATLAFVLLAQSHIGRAWRALATGPDIAVTLGIDITRYKLLAFALAAVIASISGSFYVEFTSFVGPDIYDVNLMINLFLMLFVGGRGSIVGPIVGTGVVIIVPQLISGLEQYQNLVFYILLLLLIVIRPSGLFGRNEELQSLDAILPAWLRRRRRYDPS